MRLHFFLVSVLAARTQAYAPIESLKLPEVGFVLAPAGLPSMASLAPQRLTIQARLGNVAREIVSFAANSDETITWVAKGWCIEAGGHQAGDPVFVNHCNGGPTQKWTWVSDGHGRRKIQLKDTEKCLDVSDASSLSGAPIELRACESRVTESWKFEDLAFESGSFSTGSAGSFSVRHLMIPSFLVAVLGVVAVNFRRKTFSSNKGDSTLPFSVPLARPQDRIPSIQICNVDTEGVVPALMAVSPVPSEPKEAVSNYESGLEARASVGLPRRNFLASATAGALWTALPQASTADGSNIYQPPPTSLSGKTVLITGANTGLGLESAKRLAKAGAKVILTARTEVKADIALNAVSTEVPTADVKALVLDLASLESVRSFPARYDKAVGSPIDVLLNNAGVMAIPERLTTQDGFEKTVGINHLGHFALVAGMLPVLRKASNGFRVINVSSEAHKFATEESMDTAIASNLDPKEYSQWGSYGLSKAANVLFSNELQRRMDAAGVRGSAVSLHPGGVATDLGRYLVQGVDAAEAGVPLKQTYEAFNPIQKGLLSVLATVVLTVPEGANTQVFLAAAADSNGDLSKDGGKYFDKMKVAKAENYTNSPELASKLWEVSEKLTGSKIAF